VVPTAELVSGGSDAGSHIKQVDGPDACRQPTPNADGNQTSGRDDPPARKDNGGPASDGTAGKPQVDPPEYRSFGDYWEGDDRSAEPWGVAIDRLVAVLRQHGVEVAAAFGGDQQIALIRRSNC
jgi:hypothetical protein